MAGGVGSRLGSITKKIPKPIIRIHNKPYLEYLLNWLISNGFKKFYFLLSYKNEKIKNFLAQFFLKKNLKYKIFLDKKKIGNIFSLKRSYSKNRQILFLHKC